MKIRINHLGLKFILGQGLSLMRQLYLPTLLCLNINRLKLTNIRNTLDFFKLT